MTLKDKLMKIREVLDSLQTAFTISSVTIIVLQILNVISISATVIPLPIVLGVLYLLVKCIPVSISSIKKLLKNKNFDLTEEEIKDLTDIQTIINDKCTTINGQMTNRSEPISQNTDNVTPSVYVDIKGIEYIKRY